MADTADLKSASPKGEWGFESPPAYQKFPTILTLCGLTYVSRFSYLTATLTATSSMGGCTRSMWRASLVYLSKSACR
jgi:hypothetical protein